MNVTSALVRRGAALTATVCTIAALAAAPSALAQDPAADSTAAASAATTTTTTDTTDAQFAPADAGVMAADAAADAEADAGSTADAAADAFTANGQNFATFKEALAEAVKTDDKTVTINQSTTENLTVDRDYAGVTVTAAEGVELRGSLIVSAKNVTVTGVHFILDDTSTVNLSVKANNGTTVTGCTFDITGTRAGQFNSIWAAYVQDLTFEGNTFNIAVNVQDNSWVGINLVGNGTSVVRNVKINNNTLNGLAPVNDTWNADGKAPNLFLVIANGNVKEEGGYGIENLTATGNKTFDKTGVAQSNTLVYGISFNNVNGATFSGNSFEGYMGFAYTGWPNQASSKGVTIKDNTLDTRVGIRLRDTDVAEGELTLKDNTFGAKNEIPFSGNGVTTAVAVTDQNGKTYSSVQKAVDAGAVTITLLQKTVGSVTIPAGREVTLDLNGYTLVNANATITADANVAAVADEAGHTITNNGRLTVTDSSVGKTGVVDNVTHGKAALSNEEGATATLTGGTFRRSTENSGDNSYYVLLNHGDMTIEAPTKVESKNADGGTLSNKSSLIDNGWFSGEPTKGRNATLVINGGTFEGGLYVKNDSYGELTINGGTIKGSSAAVFNWNKTTINGGEFSTDTGRQVIWNGGVSVDDDAEGANVGQLTINGGTFTAAEGQTTLAQYKGDLTEGQEHHVEVKVTGGTFNGALADDLVNAQISGGKYTVRPSEGYLADCFEVYGSDGNYHVKEEIVPTPPPASKKPTSITGVAAADAWYDGQAHAGYTGEPTSDFKGTYTVTYSGTGATKYGPSAEAPKAAGTYRVTISVPSSDSTWYGSLALDFSIRSGSTVVSRFYAPAQGVQGLHMWTTSDVESAVLGASGWNREGDAFAMDAHTGTPVYRLYDPAGNQHLWTVSVEERNHLIAVGWNDEGIAFYESPTADVDVYRLYNPWTGEHLWTTSLLERDTLASLPDGAAWTYEGVAFKALA